MSVNPSAVMILAAGLGQRMRPITDHMPKPMVKIYGKSLISRVIERFIEFGIKKIVINLHYKAEMLKRHVLDNFEQICQERQIELLFSYEEVLLETGGGILKALPLLGKDPFFVVNSDVFWVDDESESALEALANNWSDDKNGLLLVQEMESFFGYSGKGDYSLSDNGLIQKTTENSKKYVFPGVYILNPRIFSGITEIKPFKVLAIFDDLIAKQDAFCGIVHKGVVFHVGTPESIENTEKLLEEMGFFVSKDRIIMGNLNK